MYVSFILILGVLSSSPGVFAKAGASLSSDNYVSDVRQENSDVGEPLVLLPVPESILKRKSFQEQLFDPRLSDEFSRRYEDTFGRTQAEVTYRERGRIDYVQAPNGDLISVRQRSDAEYQFGTYMFRRMVEYHFDNYSKTQESLRQVQEVKERVTNYEVEVAPGYSLKSNYSISGNYIDINLNNPYIGSRARLEMDPAQLGPSQIREARIAIDRGLTSTINLEGHYTVYDGIAALVTRKSLTSQSSMSLTGSTYLTKTGSSTREHLGLLGYSLSF